MLSALIRILFWMYEKKPDTHQWGDVLVQVGFKQNPTRGWICRKDSTPEIDFFERLEDPNYIEAYQYTKDGRKWVSEWKLAPEQNIGMVTMSSITVGATNVTIKRMEKKIK